MHHSEPLVLHLWTSNNANIYSSQIQSTAYIAIIDFYRLLLGILQVRF